MRLGGTVQPHNAPRHPDVTGFRKTNARLSVRAPKNDNHSIPKENCMNLIKVIVAAGMVAAATPSFAADITGAGSTFIFPVLSKWADASKKDSGNAVNYQSIGSGAGIQQVEG